MAEVADEFMETSGHTASGKKNKLKTAINNTVRIVRIPKGTLNQGRLERAVEREGTQWRSCGPLRIHLERCPAKQAKRKSRNKKNEMPYEIPRAVFLGDTNIWTIKLQIKMKKQQAV